MKNLLSLITAVCMTACSLTAASAQEAAPQSILYGYFRLDYDYNKSMSENQTANAFDGFNIARSRVGWEYQMNEVLKSVVEVELFEKQKLIDNDSAGTDEDEVLRTIDIRLANINWEIVRDLFLSAGKMYQAFTPESLDLYDKKTDCIQIAYAFGTNRFVLQAGGNDDVDQQSLLIMPSLIITHDFGDICFEAGINGQLVTPYATGDDMGFGANIYVIIGISGFEAVLDADALHLLDQTASVLNTYATLSYAIGAVKPVINTYFYDITGNRGDMETNIDFGAEIEAVKGFVFYPFVTLKNLGQANGGGIDWELTLRFQWKPKYRF